MKKQQEPYKSFGEVLKKLRSTASKTPAEVSGAVEIDENRLEEYESGQQRPTEDILFLLIKHFNLGQERAEELWRLAGYTGQPDVEKYFINDEFGNAQQVSSSISAQDPRIIYTDMIQVMVNNYGVILNFMQGAGSGNTPLAVSRVGMSKEHARSIVAILQKTLDQVDTPDTQKLLKAPVRKPNTNPKDK